MKAEVEETKIPKGFIEVHETDSNLNKRLINIQSIERVKPRIKRINNHKIIDFSCIYCSNFKGIDGIDVDETYEEVKQLIQNAL